MEYTTRLDFRRFAYVGPALWLREAHDWARVAGNLATTDPDARSGRLVFKADYVAGGRTGMV